jgi:hypothetical protein
MVSPIDVDRREAVDCSRPCEKNLTEIAYLRVWKLPHSRVKARAPLSFCTVRAADDYPNIITTAGQSWPEHEFAPADDARGVPPRTG